MEKLVLVKTLEELAGLSRYLEDKDVICFDTETTGVDKDAEIIGYSFCAEEELAYYVVVSYWDAAKESLTYLETKEGTKALLSTLVGKRLVMHNAVFDCDKVFNNYGVDLMPSVFADTMVMAHLLDENRRVGLKDLALSIYGEDATKEQALMHESVTKNGGVLTKDKYELYKADAVLIGKYGAKDTILTLKVLYHLLPDLYDQKLDTFFFDDECMPLLRGPTYDLNTTGLRVDAEKLQALRASLEADCMEAKDFIYREIFPHVKSEYPGTSKANTFNMGAGQQLAWLLFIKLGEPFSLLTDSGKQLAKSLPSGRIPYTHNARLQFVKEVREYRSPCRPCLSKGKKLNNKGVMTACKPCEGTGWKTLKPHAYMSTDVEALTKVAHKHKWVSKLLEYKKNLKILNTYVEAIQEKMQYNIIRPSFLQTGTDSGRYSSRSPNFQNLPRDDKRVKACIISRPGKVFVGADYAQLEPRVFASFSKDERLLKCFKDGDDFYSVIGSEVFQQYDCTLKKDGSPSSFPVKYKKLLYVSKIIALATPYGTTAPQMSSEIEKKTGQVRSTQECQEIIDDYFYKYPSVEKLMLDSHNTAKADGVVYNLFGRPRRIPDATKIPKAYGKNTPHGELPREARTLLNVSMNFPIQSTGASIVNRAAIAFCKVRSELRKEDPRWDEAKIVLQVHDELVLEGPEELADSMSVVLKDCMENTVILPGVDLVAKPVIARNLADLK